MELTAAEGGMILHEHLMLHKNCIIIHHAYHAQSASWQVLALVHDSKGESCAQLNGSIPAWGADGGMSSLQWADLSWNRLTGSNPQSLKR